MIACQKNKIHFTRPETIQSLNVPEWNFLDSRADACQSQNMKSFCRHIVVFILFFCGLFLSDYAAAEEVWTIESGHEDDISAVFDTENVLPAPSFSVESMKVENGAISVSIKTSDNRSAQLNVRNAADNSEPGCSKVAGLHLCFSKTSDTALASGYEAWLLPRLGGVDLSRLWSRKAVPVPESAGGGVTQAYPFMKIFFAFWLALFAALVAFLFLRGNRLNLPTLPRLLVRIIAALIFTVLCLALAGVLFGDWPHIR